MLVFRRPGPDKAQIHLQTGGRRAGAEHARTPDGNAPLIDGIFENVRPLTEEEKTLIAAAAKKLSQRQFQVASGATKWIDDLPFQAALERLTSQPTVNIEGIYGGYTGPGGKTILPHRASAKLDLRLVPNQTAEEILAKLKAHLARRGYGDIEVNFTGGYSPTTTSAEAAIIKAQVAVLKRNGTGSRPLAAARGLLSRFCLHRSAAEPRRRPFRTRARWRRPCAGRIFCHRVQQPEGEWFRRRHPILRRVSLRIDEVVLFHHSAPHFLIPTTQLR